MKIALITGNNNFPKKVRDKLSQIKDVDYEIFLSGEDFLDDGYKADLLISLTAAQPKLFNLPCYLVLDYISFAQILRNKKFIRNFLTYDSYIGVFADNKAKASDLIFSARKFAARILDFGQSITDKKIVSDFYLSNISSNVKKLKTFHQSILGSQGYNSKKSKPKEVAYIIRTGGKPKYLLEALDSLAKQSHNNITVIFVLYKDLEIEKHLLKKYEKTLKFIILPGLYQLRSTAIIAGMKAVDAEYFGLLDDDDMLHPNHVTSLLNALNYHNELNDFRGKIRLVYSASYLVAEHKVFSEKPEWQNSFFSRQKYKRIIEHFRFYEVEAMRTHNWFMMSNSWLAHRSLINHELLRDPETHSNEDIYFELQFAQYTHFAFSCEVTAMHRFHGDNSTLLDKYRHQEDFFRHSLSNCFRVFPNGKLYRSIHFAEDSNISKLKLSDKDLSRAYDKKLQGHVLLNIKVLFIIFCQKIKRDGFFKACKKALHFCLKMFGRNQ